MKRVILHLDMNSYFASVEQQANPFLRGRPVAVCAYLSPRGCIIASSKEAKAKGIRTGMRVSEAVRIDPGVALVENEPAKYRTVTESIFGILADYTDRMEPYSIDEAFLDLTGWTADFKRAAGIAREIQERIKKEAGGWLKCSIGISHTRFLAKFAGDIAPKGGILIIRKGGEGLVSTARGKEASFSEFSLDEALSGRMLTDAWGINSRMEARLRLLGINDLFELKNADPWRLKRSLGCYGYYLWRNMNGLDIGEVGAGAPPPKSIGHSYAIPKKTRDKEYLSKVLYKLAEKTGRRLRAHPLQAGQTHAYLACEFRSGLQKTVRIPGGIFTTDEIYEPLWRWLEQEIIPSPVFMAAVSVSSLAPVSGQSELFGGRTKKRKACLAMDRLNDKYGEYTVIKGSLFGASTIARDRIGFRKTLPVPEERRGEPVLVRD